jgi:hypothetical protein
MQMELEELILSREGIPASHSVMPGSDLARKMTVTSGLRCAVLSKHSGPLGSLVRTLLDTSAWASTMCFMTWTDSATPRKRLLFRLVPSTPRTGETEHGWWPTPNAGLGKQSYSDNSAAYYQKRERDGRQQDLALAMFQSENSGNLSPEWVEWLMGFPIGHTDLKHSETP